MHQSFSKSYPPPSGGKLVCHCLAVIGSGNPEKNWPECFYVWQITFCFPSWQMKSAKKLRGYVKGLERVTEGLGTCKYSVRE